MKRLLFLLIFLAFSSDIFAQTVLVETELFVDKGGWSVDAQFVDQMGSPYLLAHGLGKPVADASTVVKFPETGNYHVWVRTKDWAPFPKGPGNFQLLIDKKPLDMTFGSTGIAGWEWYYGGVVDISQRNTEVALHDLTGFDGRCDAVCFSKSENIDLPNDIAELSVFRESQLDLPAGPHDEGNFDLVVVGGGVAGICAAVQAARLGMNVALVNNRPVLGGASSSEIRVSTDGDTFRNKYPKLGRIVREIDNYHAGVGGSAGEMYGDKQRKNLIRNEKGITLFENMHVNGVEMDGNRIKGVIAMNLNTLEKHRISGTLFSDCTGDATVGLLAGAEHKYGRKSRAETGEFTAPEVADGLTMGSSNQWFAKNTDRRSEFPEQEWMLRFSGDYHFDIVHSVWNWETGFGNFHIVDQAEEIRDHNLRAIYGNWAYLKSNKPEKYGNYELSFLAYVAGKRESYRLVGDVFLKQQDIDDKVEYPDAVVTTTWGIDLHYPDPKNTEYFPGQEFVGYAVHPSKQADVYTFPYRCLYSCNIDNLFMAGRNISVSHVALGAVRVQRCTGMMGEVVGIAAYLCDKLGCSPRDLYRKHLAELIDAVK